MAIKEEHRAWSRHLSRIELS